MHELDLKDKKILFELDFNARQSYADIARTVGLSKQVVEYRINNLIKKGIITGFYPVINASRLGYIYSRTSITLHNISEKELEQFFTYLKEHPKVFWIIEMQGPFDVGFVTWVKTLKEYRQFVDELMSKYSSWIKRKIENIATDVIHYQHRYLLGKTQTKEIHVEETIEREDIDELDKDILRQLNKNARIPLLEIATALKENPRTIAYRIKRLEKSKIIEAYRTSIDHSKLGFTYYKLFLNLTTYNAQDMKKLREFIKNNPSTIYYVEGIALHADIDFEMMIRNNQELFDFIKTLRREFPKMIGDYTAAIFMDTLKVKYLPF